MGEEGWRVGVKGREVGVEGWESVGTRMGSENRCDGKSLKRDG